MVEAGPGEQGGAPVVDPARLRDLAASLGGELDELIATFLEDAPGQIDALEAGSRRADLEAVARAAHSLKSSSGIFGARRLVALSQSLEEAAARGALPDPASIQQLRVAYRKTESVLNSYKQQS